MSGSSVVAEILRTSGLSKSALSSASGVSRSLIDAYLKGTSQPSVAQLDRLAESAGCDLDIQVHRRPERPASWDEFIAVLEFGELFPAKERAPLPDMKPIWDAARRRADSKAC